MSTTLVSDGSAVTIRAALLDDVDRSCISWAQAASITIVKLGVAVTNRSAIRCSERCGFSVYGTEPRALF